LQRHALSTIESGIEDATPPDDELLLRILAAAVRRGDKLTASELLAEAQQADTAMFRGWSAKAVSAHLKRYAIRSRKTGGRPIFDPRPDELARVQASYSIDLDMPTAVPPPENVPHVPYVPREPKARPDLGHVGHVGVRSQEGIPDAF
jgi:hypothetical protein